MRDFYSPCILALVITLAAPARGAEPRGHCQPATVTPVPGEPGAYRIETPKRTTIARRAAPPPTRTATEAVVEITVYPYWFDADGDTIGTPHDTVVVAPGTVVRWVREGPGFHTITSGRDSGDPTAESEYNAVYDDLTTSFEHTFDTPGLHDFFCYMHEPGMMGSVLVGSLDADPPASGAFRRATFSRDPSPNPSRRGAGFAIVLPRSATVRLEVLDVSGRTVARIHDGALSPGEHPFHWDGLGRDGRAAPSGRYFIRLKAGDVRETRSVSIAR